MASPNNDTRQFLFDGPDIAIPDDKKPELIKILEQRYEDLNAKTNKDNHDLIFIKQLDNLQLDNLPKSNPSSSFEEILTNSINNNELVLGRSGAIDLKDYDETDPRDYLVQFFLNRKSSYLTQKEYEKLGNKRSVSRKASFSTDETPHYQTASSQSSQPDAPSNLDIGGTLNQLSTPFNQLAQSIDKALVIPAHDLWEKAHESLQKSPALPTFFPPKIEPQSSVQNFDWLQQSIREIGNSLQEIRNPFEGGNVQQLIGLFQPKQPPTDHRQSSSSASSAQTMSQKSFRKIEDPNHPNNGSSRREDSANSSSTSVRSPSTSANSPSTSDSLSSTSARSSSTSARSSSTSQDTNLSRRNTPQNRSSSSQGRPWNISPAPTKAPPSTVAIFGKNAIEKAQILAMNNPGQPFAAGNKKFTCDPKTKEMIIEELKKNKPNTRKNPSPTKTPTR